MRKTMSKPSGSDGRAGLRGAFAANAIPAIISMILTSGVVLVDGAFLGRAVGPDALAAVNLGLPLLYAFMGMALFIAVGFSSQAAVALGAGDRDRASRYFSAAAITVVAVCGVAALASGLAADTVATFLARGSALSPTLRDYLSVMAPGYFFVMLSITLSVFARAEGRPMDALVIGLVANVANVALDWLLIVALGLGVRGAAAATGIAAALGCVAGLARVLLGRSSFRFVMPRIGPGEYASALANGLSELIGQYSITLTTWMVNAACLRTMGAAGLAALTVAGYLSFVESMVVTGLCIGMGPIVGRAYGAGDASTGAGVLRIAARAAFVTGGAAFALAALGGRAAAMFWTGGDERIAEIAAKGFALFGMGFLANGFNAVAAAWFTARCDARRSGAIAALRGLLLPVLAITALPAAFGATGVWLAMPAAELLTLAYSIPAARRHSLIS
ncbi:MAG: MATE family efflux transporter [Spirochaetae bacterium HGW-Spirochaetae-3]|jgi:Na+-driven multidrug efflux pump|nr:MAG: MATE family efflux transporter [Spirochaetae bacterium HGW-Spirochaetae-3]